jgi:membrane protein YdbS with pleckstrin-like domain
MSYPGAVLSSRLKPVFTGIFFGLICALGVWLGFYFLDGKVPYPLISSVSALIVAIFSAIASIGLIIYTRFENRL